MINFLKRLVLFAVLIAGALLLLTFFRNLRQVMQFAWICYGLFFVMSIVMYYFSRKTMHGKFGNFMAAFFTGIFSKLVIVAIIVVVYKIGHPDTSTVDYVIPFAVVYFSFLIFETAELVKLSNRSGARNRKNEHS